MGACGSTPRPTPSATTQPTSTAGLVTPTPTAVATPNACAAPSGEPAPRGVIPANFATALAFAPDGRLFWAERSGTVRVWQNGASRVFASVRTVIIDEIHALAGDKRGAHLALSLERLEALTAFVEVDPTKDADVEATIYECGLAYCAIQVPARSAGSISSD